MGQEAAANFMAGSDSFLLFFSSPFSQYWKCEEKASFIHPLVSPISPCKIRRAYLASALKSFGTQIELCLLFVTSKQSALLTQSNLSPQLFYNVVE